MEILGKRVAVAAAVAVLALAGCTQNMTDLEKAQAQVTAKQKALDDAQDEFDASSTAFCDATTDYILALDTYGDVLTDTAPTVGDVRNAGAYLAAPKVQTIDAATAATDARAQLTIATQELADAEAALAAIEAGPSGGPSIIASVSASPAPVVPDATVDRVKQAEDEFADVQGDISDDTPLREAAEPFHSAALALELSWMRLFMDAGCATDEQAANAKESVAGYTKALQQDLKTLGFYKGEIDGIYGPQTTQAVSDLQKDAGLAQTGTVDIATAQALRDAMVAAELASATDQIASTAVLQQLLEVLGYWDGPVDGIWTDDLTDAVKDFQRDLGVDPSGEVDAATVAAFQKALEEAKASLVPDDQPTDQPEPAPSPSATASD
ncbi:peptidoglycan-binding domain-containing protein [Demequina sp.]|uniref:peptidoglycan-binding domain-containing protein n=1 Tax=Demequina sp. TaxID=2050685 RepID=UPI003D10E199